MSTDDTYNGYTNRETWAVALYINNDQGWQEQIHEALRNAEDIDHYQAADIIRENVETMLDPQQYRAEFGEQQPEALAIVLYDIGSLYRVDWDELGRVFLEDLKDIDS
jgi:hypothetical protein